jgi:hypothetical protein
MITAFVFATFLEQAGPENAKREGDGEKFRMSEHQRVAELPSPHIFARLAEIVSQKYWRLPLSAEAYLTE